MVGKVSKDVEGEDPSRFDSMATKLQSELCSKTLVSTESWLNWCRIKNITNLED